MIDGDTLELAGERVRLMGIDAPEGAQVCQRDGRDWACGDEAAAALGELVAADVRVRTASVRPDRSWLFLDRHTTPSSLRLSRRSAGCGRVLRAALGMAATVS